MELLYCSRCNRSIPPGGLDEGRYFRLGNEIICPKCYHKMKAGAHSGNTVPVEPVKDDRLLGAERLPPAPAERGKRPSTSRVGPAVRPPTSRVGPAVKPPTSPNGPAVKPPSSHLMAAARKPPSSKRLPAIEGSSAASSSARLRAIREAGSRNRAIFIGVLLAASVLSALAIFHWAGGQPGAPPPATGTGPEPAPPVKPSPLPIAPPPSAAPDLSRGLVGHWSFDEDGGDTAKDSSGCGHDGRLVGAPKQVEGRLDRALEFDGKDARLEIDQLAVNAAPGGRNTVAFWMKWDGRDQQMPFGWNGKYDLFLWDGAFGINTGEWNIIGIPSSGLAGRWVHVAAVFPNALPGPDNCRLYIGGVAQKVASLRKETKTARAATPRAFVSGWGDSAGLRFGGCIDDLRIYNRELTAEEVKELAAVDRTAPVAPEAPAK